MDALNGAAQRCLTCALALALLGVVTLAHGQIYRCTDANGRTTYGDAPCAQGGHALKVPQSASHGFGDATVCAQLQDEMQRLDADARRAKQITAKKADDSKRRQKLAAQYERRCESIHRSEP
ncbi:MAG TPA: DUF4124 domain-containing protein [Casimicrobiaceae bacterium]|nr:DUF4124 domain-containing protein [Casimicrobiaceae bacterium]